MKTPIFGHWNGGLFTRGTPGPRELAPRGLGSLGGGRHLAFALAASALLFGQALSTASETDENLEASVRGAYVFRTLLAEEGISMEVSNGRVTLRGNVGIPLQRELAEEAVAALPGVKSIDNQIVVKPAGLEEADALLALRVKTILGMHRSGRAHAARVEVKDGVVTLRGEAVDEGERVLVAAQAADVEGVGEVNNELAVALPKAAEAAAAKAGNGRSAAGPGPVEPAGAVDDASVAAQVRLALRAHRSTRSLTPGVEAREGVVTLTGHVRDAAEKEHVSWLCSDILGVVKVDNKMTPEPETTENQ